MSDLDYLRGEWESFKRFEHEEHAEIKAHLVSINQKIDLLNEFKFRTYGVVSVVGLFTGGLAAALVDHLLR